MLSGFELYPRWVPSAETIGFSPYKSLYFEYYATMSMIANAHISSLGYLWLFWESYTYIRGGKQP